MTEKIISIIVVLGIAFFTVKGIVALIFEKWGDKPKVSSKSPMAKLIIGFDYAQYAKGHPAWLTVSRLIDYVDLMTDDFKRIKSLTHGENGESWQEIAGLCDRAIGNTHQHFPVIVQRDKLEIEARDKQMEVYSLGEQNKLLKTQFQEVVSNRDELAVNLAKANEALELLKMRIAEYEKVWDTDTPLSELEEQAIDSCHPDESDDHKTYFEALRLVNSKHSKYGLVSMLNWKLHELRKSRELNESFAAESTALTGNILKLQEEHEQLFKLYTEALAALDGIRSEQASEKIMRLLKPAGS